jgi:hypothetical protein
MIFFWKRCTPCRKYEGRRAYRRERDRERTISGSDTYVVSEITMSRLTWVSTIWLMNGRGWVIHRNFKTSGTITPTRVSEYAVRYVTRVVKVRIYNRIFMQNLLSRHNARMFNTTWRLQSMSCGPASPMENDFKKATSKLLTSMFVTVRFEILQIVRSQCSYAVRIGDLESVVDVFRSLHQMSRRNKLFQRGWGCDDLMSPEELLGIIHPLNICSPPITPPSDLVLVDQPLATRRTLLLKHFRSIHASKISCRSCKNVANCSHQCMRSARQLLHRRQAKR